MANGFERVGLTAPKYNWFDMNHPVLTSFDIGRLVPAKCFEVFPGNRVKIGVEHLIRFQQMYAPVFQRFDVRFDVGFYPYRLAWPEALDFFRGGNSGNTEYPYPRIWPGYIYCGIVALYLHENNLQSTDVLQGNPLLHSLIDYFNMSTFDDVYNSLIEEVESPTYNQFLTAVVGALQSVPPISVLPFIMYQGMFRQWYRNKQVDLNLNEDQDWQYGTPEYWRNLSNWKEYLPDIPVYDLLQLLPADFRNTQPQNYETAILAWQTIGTNTMRVIDLLFGVRDVRFANDYFTSALPSPLMPEVQIPMGNVGFYNSNGQLVSDIAGLSATGVGGSSGTKQVGFAASNSSGIYGGSLRVDAGTIQMLRQASAMDQYQLRSALGGNGTSQDWILAHYGVKSSDTRLDIPQMLGRAKSFVSISEVTQTSQSSTDSSLGEFAGHGISVNNHGLCDFFVEEPGLMFVFMSVVPKQAYFQGMPKLFTRHDRFDFPIPEFAQIGMEPVDRRELYLNSEDVTTPTEFGEDVLGYQDRYASYKTMLPEIHGDFRSSLSSWHDSRMFSQAPALNSDFIKVDHFQGLDRIFNVTDGKENKLLALLQFNISIEQALPVYPRYSL